MYEAGRAAGRAEAASASRRHAWTSMLAASVVLGGSILLAARAPRPADGPPPAPVGRTTVVNIAREAEPDRPGPDSYLVLTRTLLTSAPGAWPDRPSRPATSPTAPRRAPLSPRDARDFDRLPHL